MRTISGCVLGGFITLFASPALANVIMVSPADGTTGYKKIEGAQPGDEVIIAPGTYAYRVYLTQTATAAQPIYIHAQDPANPPVWDFGKTLVENAPGSYTADDKGRGCWQFVRRVVHHHRRDRLPALQHCRCSIRRVFAITVARRALTHLQLALSKTTTTA